MDKALSDAGFGIQLADVTIPKGERHFGSEIPVSTLNGKAASVEPAPQIAPAQEASRGQKPVTAEKPPVKPAPKAVEKPAPAPKAEQPPVSPVARVEVPPVVVTVPTEVPVTPKAEPVTPPASTPGNGTHQALDILRGGAVPAVAPVAEPAKVPVAEYTQDMPVEEIIKRMSLEQAKAVVVDSGTCRGKTIEEVAARRKASLRFYLTPGYTSKNNIIRAAARIMLDSLDQKAG